MYRILTINLGGTSAKLAVYEDECCVSEYNMEYSQEETDQSLTAGEEIEVKAANIKAWLSAEGFSAADFDAIAPRFGGAFYGGDGGTFYVEGELRDHLNGMFTPEKPAIHATYLTMGVINELMKGTDKEVPVLTTDPCSVNQLFPEARITGNPLFLKRIAFHALNQRAVARKAAAQLGKRYDEVNLIVAHIGGGVSVGAHMKGRIVDVNDSAGDGDGPFSPNRAGTVPGGQLIHECFSGKYTEKEAFKLLKGEAGLKAYLGTEDLRVVEKMIDNGDEKAELVFNALAYQIAREIGACYASLSCKADGIVLTAGMAYSDRLVRKIEEKVGGIAPVLVFPGAHENEALALGALRILRGEETPGEYEGEALNIQPAY